MKKTILDMYEAQDLILHSVFIHRDKSIPTKYIT
jgi:hypothetical protein